MRFQGTFATRSSANPNLRPPSKTPPGESEILRLNPARKQRILVITGWPRLEPGSLNLSIDSGVLEALLLYTPVWTELGSTVRYPPGWEHIPALRGEYYYYGAQANAAGKSEAVLVRRPKNTVRYPMCVELFAATNLTALFGLQLGHKIAVELDLAQSSLK